MTSTPLKSKKFIAWVIASFAWKSIIVWLIYAWHEEPLTLFQLIALETFTVSAFFLDIGYIGTTAWLDRYLAVARAGLDSISSLRSGGDTVTSFVGVDSSSGEKI